MPFQAIIFDCDGVLINSPYIEALTFHDTLNEDGIPFSMEDYEALIFGRTTAEQGAQIAKLYEQTFQSPMPEKYWQDLKGRAKHIILEQATLMPNVLETLKRIKLPMAVASNSEQQELEDKLHRYGLHDCFAPHYFSADDVQRGKPAPDLYLKAAQALGVDPRNCLVVEDSPSGARAGLDAGAQVAGFVRDFGETQKKMLQKEGVNYLLEDLREIIRIL